jgi:hypothetical protein
MFRCLDCLGIFFAATKWRLGHATHSHPLAPCPRVAASRHPGVRQDFERLDVKITLGAARRRARASEARRFLSGRPREFSTIGPGQNLSSARVEP